MSESPQKTNYKQSLRIIYSTPKPLKNIDSSKSKNTHIHRKIEGLKLTWSSYPGAYIVREEQSYKAYNPPPPRPRAADACLPAIMSIGPSASCLL